jgi:hypothetical protein
MSSVVEATGHKPVVARFQPRGRGAKRAGSNRADARSFQEARLMTA